MGRSVISREFVRRSTSCYRFWALSALTKAMYSKQELSLPGAQAKQSASQFEADASRKEMRKQVHRHDER